MQYIQPYAESCSETYLYDWPGADIARLHADNDVGVHRCAYRVSYQHIVTAALALWQLTPDPEGVTWWARARKVPELRIELREASRLESKRSWAVNSFTTQGPPEYVVSLPAAEDGVYVAAFGVGLHHSTSALSRTLYTHASASAEVALEKACLAALSHTPPLLVAEARIIVSPHYSLPLAFVDYHEIRSLPPAAHLDMPSGAEVAVPDDALFGFRSAHESFITHLTS